jgi:uncharacterized protein (TIGR01777 family)
MRIGIIGATGFIGGALARVAVPRGIGVVAFSRRQEVFLPWAKEVRPVMEEGPAIDPRGLDAVVNLAGEPIIGFWTRKKKQRIQDSRVPFTERVVDAIKNCPAAERPKVLINGSAVGIYGDRGDEVLTEKSVSGTSFLAKVCTGWESAACHAQAAGLRVVLLRTGLVLGNGGGMWKMVRRIFSLGLGGRLGSGKQWMPWIHLDDEVGIIMHTLENSSISGAVNLCAPNPVTNAEFTAAVAGVLKKPAVLPAPAFAMKLMLGDLGRSILESQRAVPKVAAARGYEFQHPELTGALRHLMENKNPQ